MSDEQDSKDNQKKSENQDWPFLFPHPNDWHHTLKEIISAFGLLLGLIVAIGVIYLLVDIISLYFSPDVENRFSNLRTSLFILAALVGVPFFLWRTWIAQQQSNIADKQAETARDRAYTELFTKAIEQLGAEKPKKEEVQDKKGKSVSDNSGQPQMRETYVPNIEVRIGAIFALERIMKDSEKDAAAVVNTLAAYVRENCGKPTLECEIPEEKNYITTGEWVGAIKEYVGNLWQPEEGTLVARAKALKEQQQVNRADIKTVLTVIGRRPDWLKNPEKFKNETAEMPDLRDVNFQGWDLSSFDLSHCNLQGAEMQGANLRDAEMQGANMSSAKIDKSPITKARKTAASVIEINFTKASFEFDELQAQLPEMFGHKEKTILPDGMTPPEFWSKADMQTYEGSQQYDQEWEDFKKEKGVE